MRAEKGEQGTNRYGGAFALSSGVCAGSSKGKGEEIWIERNVDSRTCKRSVVSIRFSASHLVFDTIPGQPGSSLPQSPQPDSQTPIFPLSPKPQSLSACAPEVAQHHQLYNLHCTGKGFPMEPRKCWSLRL